MPPWQVIGERPTRWRKLVWRYRYVVYYEQVQLQRQKQNDAAEKARLKSLRNGRKS